MGVRLFEIHFLLAGFMLELCWIYAGVMLDLCWIYAGFMLDLCWIYVQCRLPTQRIHYKALNITTIMKAIMNDDFRI